ncbi:MAG TPA: response regulator, partial [Flavobacteriales bacterium]|nr:response regulator [Flavobacteriales bacterium]
MKHIRAIVVDDEPAARTRIARLLSQDPEIELIAECRNGNEAIEAVGKHRPDLMFLDVQMPQVNGFEVVARIGRERMPFVVFVTAHDQYALKAFDVNAVDYLLKPYDDERFHSSLEKAKKFIEMRTSTKLTGKLMDLVREHMHAQSEFIEVFTIRDKGREHKV